jgi:hypothetical protein
MSATIHLTALGAVQIGQEIVDSIVGAVDLNRTAEIERPRLALEAIGLDALFQSELRLTGVPSICDGECWVDADGETAR